MNIKKTRLWTGIILFTCLIFAILSFIFVESFLMQPGSSDSEIDQIAVEHLLKLAQENQAAPIMEMKTDRYLSGALIDSHISENEKCWMEMHNLLTENENAYTISASDPLRSQGRDVDNTVVIVEFENGKKMLFTFYQLALVNCSIKP